MRVRMRVNLGVDMDEKRNVGRDEDGNKCAKSCTELFLTHLLEVS